MLTASHIKTEILAIKFLCKLNCFEKVVLKIVYGGVGYLQGRQPRLIAAFDGVEELFLLLLFVVVPAPAAVRIVVDRAFGSSRQPSCLKAFL